MDLDTYLADRIARVDRALGRRLPAATRRPGTLHRAMRYSLFAGGKRLRPVLCLAACEACGGDPDAALPQACAIECIHTYSLIHDDLPAMDNDDFRRGKPTCHKLFGEGMAILAGDALLTLAFEILAEAPGNRRHGAAETVTELARASGSLALIAGQAADLEAEGKPVGAGMLRFIHRSKTAALLATSLRLGAMAAGATPARVAALGRFGTDLGLAFQVIDDILDVTQSTEKLGKTAGKDVAAGKATYPAVFGLPRSRAEAARLTRSARAALKPFGARGAALHALADHLLAREY